MYIKIAKIGSGKTVLPVADRQVRLFSRAKVFYSK